nr:hypothetical protein [Candidatus Freyarchaeota archaeon]
MRNDEVKEELTEINPLYNAIAFGTLLTSLDKLGLKPMLVARQATRILAPIIANLAKQIYGQEPSKNLAEFVENWKVMIKKTSLVDPDKSEISLADKVISMKLTDCMYQAMADFGKSQGYPACPLCIINLILLSLIKAQGIGEVIDFSSKKSETVCLVKMVID